MKVQKNICSDYKKRRRITKKFNDLDDVFSDEYKISRQCYACELFHECSDKLHTERANSNDRARKYRNQHNLNRKQGTKQIVKYLIKENKHLRFNLKFTKHQLRKANDRIKNLLHEFAKPKYPIQ